MGKIIKNKCAYIYLTKDSKKMAERLSSEYKKGDIISYKDEFRPNKGRIFSSYEVFVFIMATGIVIRAIAPYIRSKFEDPAVVVMDEKGKNVISILSGHIGGANKITEDIAKVIGANPVITTATDLNDKAALDMIAKKLNAYIKDFRNVCVKVNTYLLEEKTVYLYIDEKYKNIRINTNGFTLIDKDLFTSSEFLEEVHSDKLVVISDKVYKNEDFIKVVPKAIVVGTGCKKDTDSLKYEKSLISVFEKEEIDINAIGAIGSIDVKENEVCIVDFAKKYEAEFVVFTKEEIEEVDWLFSGSEFVKRMVGVYSVAEPAAYMLSDGNIISKKRTMDGITISLGRLLAKKR